MRWIIRWTPLKRWGFFWFQHVWSRLICETCVTRIMAWELAFHSHYLKHPEPETNEHLSHPELLSLWCFHCRHCFVLSANSTVVAVVGEEDQDFLTRQIRILYGSCNGRAVTGSLCSPRSLSFSFALNVVEVVSNQLSCKRSFRLGSPEAKTQECRLCDSFTCCWLQNLQCLRYTHLMGHLWSFIRAAERSLWFVFSHYTKDLTQAL